MNVAPLALQPDNNRILIIDDNPAIHQDFRKILGPADAALAKELDVAEASLFGDKANTERAAIAPLCKPKPWPPLRVVKPCAKMRVRFSGEMPMPLSETTMWT